MTNRAGCTIDTSRATRMEDMMSTSGDVRLEFAGIEVTESNALSKPDSTSNHYKDGSAPCPHCNGPLESIDIIDMFNLDFFEGNINKYLLRYKHRGERVKDLKKLVQYAQWLLEREQR